MQEQTSHLKQLNHLFSKQNKNTYSFHYEIIRTNKFQVKHMMASLIHKAGTSTQLIEEKTIYK